LGPLAMLRAPTSAPRSSISAAACVCL
jgi:hypothetical protein